MCGDDARTHQVVKADTRRHAEAPVTPPLSHRCVDDGVRLDTEELMREEGVERSPGAADGNRGPRSHGRTYGLRLMPELYECYNPMPYDAARDMEVELAIALREEGYAVWQG